MQEYTSRIDTTGTWQLQDNQASYQQDPENNQTIIKETQEETEKEDQLWTLLDIQNIHNNGKNST